MSLKAVNFKMDDAEIRDLKKISGAYNMTMTDVVREALAEYITRAKQDPYYRLTANIDDADDDESNEILGEISRLSEDDLEISSGRRFRV